MLTREILHNTLPEDVFGQLGEGRYFTDKERTASLKKMLSSMPVDSDIWIFAYGSLIWNPMLRFTASKRGMLKNWKRVFCMKLTAGRASADAPGRMLALVPGSGTEGIAYQLPRDGLNDELMLLWKREMSTTSYLPLWEEVVLENAEVIFAIVFVMNLKDATYDSNYESDSIVSYIANAKGPVGTNADYLERLSQALVKHNIIDNYISELDKKVKRLLPLPHDREE